MIKSMTGFGRAEGMVGQRKFTTELRALNSKQLDMNIRMPSVYKEKEMDLRRFLGDSIIRGKLDVTVYYEAGPTDKKVSINKVLMASYYQDLKDVSDEINADETDFMSLLMRIPDVVQPAREELDEEEWGRVMKLMSEAVEKLNNYRVQEGARLKQDFEERINEILRLFDELEAPLAARAENIRKKIRNGLDELIDSEKIDANRFEQELIYYIEKLDITEERIRLKHNCDYFLEVLNSDAAQGKKLGFIAQEIGREINTMGSKANNSDVQKIVVLMKDELEKIKEQVLNVL